jgi:hypothetical protein
MYPTYLSHRTTQTASLVCQQCYNGVNRNGVSELKSYAAHNMEIIRHQLRRASIFLARQLLGQYASPNEALYSLLDRPDVFGYVSDSQQGGEVSAINRQMEIM